eukprot:5944352-Amphidinium_carterae.2
MASTELNILEPGAAANTMTLYEYIAKLSGQPADALARDAADASCFTELVKSDSQEHILDSPCRETKRALDSYCQNADLGTYPRCSNVTSQH